MKKKIIISLLTLMLIVSCVNIIPNKVFAEDEPFTFESVLDECAELTATDELEGVLIDEKVPTVIDFKNGVLNNTYSSDRILECLPAIIPEVLLYTVGEYYYEGDAYAFYVNTKLTLNNRLRKVTDVVLIDYTFEFNEENRSLITKLDIFSRVFNFSYDTDLGLISHYEPIEKLFYLANLDIIQGVENEHDLNEGDNLYLKKNDNGSILNTICLSCSGVAEQDAGEMNKDAALTVFSLVFGKIPYFGTAFSVLNAGYDIFQIYAYGDYIPVAYNDNVELNVYPSRNDQLNNGDTPYIKALRIDNFNENSNIFINDYIKLISVLDDNALETRAIQRIQFNLAKVENDVIYYLDKDAGVFVADDSTSDILPSIKADSVVMFEKSEELIIGNNAGYLLASDSVQDFTFTPTMNGLYNFSIGENYLITSNVNSEEFIGNGSLLLYLKANTEYKIRVKCAGETLPARAYNLNIEFCPEAIVAGDNFIQFNNSNHEFVNVNFAEGAYYRFVSTKANTLFSLYDENLNVIEEDKSQIIIKADGKKYYLKLASENLLTETVNVKCFKERKIQFYTNTDEVINSITFNVNENLSLPEPTPSSGYEFEGWYESEDFSGNKITNENVLLINKADFDLYAKYIPIEYSITYYSDGAIVATDKYTVFDEVILKTEITKEGCIFIGWFTNSNFTGSKVEKIYQGSVNNKIYYAKWVNEAYNVTILVDTAIVDEQVIYLKENGQIITNPVKTVNYGTTYVLPIAETKGFTFLGWALGDELITLENGESFSNYVFEEDIIVTAKWSRNEYKVKLGLSDEKNNITYYFLTNDAIIKEGEELSPDDILLSYSANLCPNCLIDTLRNNTETATYVKELFYRPGKIYSHVAYEQNSAAPLACWQLNELNFVDGAEITLYPCYVDEIYTINFIRPDSMYLTCDSNNFTKLPEEITINNLKYGSSINSSVVNEYSEYFSKDGFNFICWKFNNDTEFSFGIVGDLSSEEQNVSVNLFAFFENIIYSITYNLEGGYFYNMEEVIYEFTVLDEFDLPIPLKDDFLFLGWEDENGDYIKTIQCGTKKNIALTAVWVKQVYNIKFDANGGDGYLPSIEVEYNCTIKLPKNEFSLRGHTFLGWAMSKSGEVVFQDEENVFQLVDEHGGSITLYAIWQANVYNIIYKNLTSDMMVFVNTYTYGIGLAEMPKVYLPGGYSPTEMSHFIGWYTDINFTNEVTAISTTNVGDVTLYGQYSYLVGSTYATGPYTIESRYEDEPIFELHINLKSFNYERFKDTTLSKIFIGIKFNYYEEQDGYQQFYLYNGSTLIDNEEIDLSNDLDAKTGERAIFDPLNIEDYKDVDTLTVKFGATGFWGNDWVISNIEIDVYFTNEL